jgi:hypothetical protein
VKSVTLSFWELGGRRDENEPARFVSGMTIHPRFQLREVPAMGSTTAPLKQRRTSETKAAIAAVAAAMVTAAIALAATSSAQAITCVANTAWTSTTVAQSAKFTIAQNSQCLDLNAAYTYTNGDYVRGWYRDSGGTWHAGSRGFVYVDRSDTEWIVLLTNVVNGTVVRGEGWRYSQYVRYVT